MSAGLEELINMTACPKCGLEAELMGLVAVGYGYFEKVCYCTCSQPFVIEYDIERDRLSHHKDYS